MIEKINGTFFDLDYCRKFSPEKLRSIYRGESDETLQMLIDRLSPKETADEEPKAKKIKKK